MKTLIPFFLCVLLLIAASMAYGEPPSHVLSQYERLLAATMLDDRDTMAYLLQVMLISAHVDTLMDTAGKPIIIARLREPVGAHLSAETTRQEHLRTQARDLIRHNDAHGFSEFRGRDGRIQQRLHAAIHDLEARGQWTPPGAHVDTGIILVSRPPGAIRVSYIRFQKAGLERVIAFHPYRDRMPRPPIARTED